MATIDVTPELQLALREVDRFLQPFRVYGAGSNVLSSPTKRGGEDALLMLSSFYEVVKKHLKHE